MKKFVILIAVFFALNTVSIFAQDAAYVFEDAIDSDENFDIPYLSDEDILALEETLPGDEAPAFVEAPAEAAPKEVANEISRVNTPRLLYHVLVIDRQLNPGSDISDLSGIRVLYKFRHGRNGYLIAVYVSPMEGPVFPQLPHRSRIIVNMTSVSRNVLKTYINSPAFRRLVSNNTVRTQMLRALN